jgi:hypothetical protein
MGARKFGSLSDSWRSANRQVFFVPVATRGPTPADEMKAWPVGSRVGNVQNNDPTLVEPVAQEQSDSLLLPLHE